MSKYTYLWDYIKSQDLDQLYLTFDEIENFLLENYHPILQLR